MGRSLADRASGRQRPAPEAFLERYPEYASTAALDRLRRDEFSRLDATGQVYLDFTGGGLYADSQVRRHADLLLANVLGNPHSSNPTSSATTERVERCRRQVLEFFAAPVDEYVLIFTANASQALKLVGESYPFTDGDLLLLTFDNHNSVNGIREYDRVQGAETRYVPVEPPDLRISDGVLDSYLDLARAGRHNLFAFPAQSNFSGVQHSLKWIERAHRKGWDVLLDAAAFVPTNRLDLSTLRPDYVALSFYKMFGYPTGVGALLARRQALARLHRPWFAGGTITVASVQADSYVLAPGSEAFEDGTLNFASIPAVELGLELLQSVGMDTIHTRVRCLSGWLLDNLVALRYGNGQPLVRLYGPRDTCDRGGTVTLNFLDDQGHLVDHALVEERANRHRISLRTGCFCNPGAGEMALGLDRDALVGCFARAAEGLTYEQFRGCLHREGTGAVRVSLGAVSNLADVEAFLSFAASFARG